MSRTASGEDMRVGRQTVRITRPQKLLFPDDGIDKRQLAEYYARIASTMLPYLRSRPVTMERYPEREQLVAFVKTTGSRGLHVLVPLNRRADFE